jgi:hypothetical protein
MPVDLDSIAGYVGVDASVLDASFPGLLDVCVDLVDAYLGDNRPRVPSSIYDLAVKQLASEVWTRRGAPGGITSWGPDGQPLRLSKDTMVSVKPLLSPYRGLGVVG